MDRRNFLVGLLGVAGTATVASFVRQTEAVAGVPGNGILASLDTPAAGDIEQIVYTEGVVRHRGERRHRRRHRRRVWRRYCRREWHHGRWRRRCHRRRVWI